MHIDDAYKILGVNQGANEEQIKNAYREKARSINEMGGEQGHQMMQQLNDAYDTVINQLRMGTSGEGYVSFGDIRSMIKSGKISQAEQMLDSMPRPNRTAEWYYLKGLILKDKGWLEDAKTHFAAAARMDPSNKEYRNAANQGYQSGRNQEQYYSGDYNRGSYNNGGYSNGGYRTGPAYGSSGCSACDLCSALMCADCCCECMGKDLIRCC